MSYPSLLDLRARPDTSGLSDQALSEGLAVAVETLELYTRKAWGDTVDPATGAVVPVATPASIRLVVAGLAVFHAGGAFSRLPDRMTSLSTEMGVATIGQADAAKGRPTGFSDWDVILNRYRVPLPEVG